MKSWIGIDLDGTLAEYHGWQPNGSIGKPIPDMVKKVKDLLKNELIDVKIFTARVCMNGRKSEESGAVADELFANKQRQLIQDWCQEHLGFPLEVTCEKDFAMIELWDDRARQVIPNTGVFIDELIGRLLK